MTPSSTDSKSSLLKDATMLKEKGNSCFRNRKYKKAVTFYNKAIEKCSESDKHDLAILYQNRAAACEMLQKWSQVKTDCSKSLEYNPLYAKAYFRRAKAYEATKDILNCLEDITATVVLEMHQKNEIGEKYSTYYNCIAKQAGRDSAAKYIETRDLTLPSPYFIKCYFQTFISDPVKNVTREVDVTNGYIQAKIAFDAGNYDDVIYACSDEINSSKSEQLYKAEALLLRGTFYILLGNFKKGTGDLDEIINTKVVCDTSLRANALIKRGLLRVELEDKEGGFADFNEAEKIFPNNPDLHSLRGQVYVNLHQFSNSLGDIKKTIKLAPNYFIGYLQKCFADYGLAKNSQDTQLLLMLINEIKNDIEKFPDCMDFYILMAEALRDLNQFEEANSFCKKAIKLSPKRANLYVYHGEFLMKWKGDVETSIGLINKAIEIDNKCQMAYEALGNIEYQRGCLDQAIELFEKAISLTKIPTEVSQLYELRNIVVAKMNVCKKLGIFYVR